MTATAAAVIVGFAFLAPVILCALVMLACGSPEDRAQFFRGDE